MNDPRSFSDDEIDALVLRHLEHEAESIDPRPLLERIRANAAHRPAEATAGIALLPVLVGGDDKGSPQIRPASLSRIQRLATWRSFAYGISTAAAVALIVFALHSTEQVSAAAVLQQTLRIHSLPIDRCYIVEVQRRGYEGADLVPPSRIDRLWTRGDQFFLESTNTEHRWAWGRDEAGTVWTTYGRRAGLKLEPDEIPAWLDTSCDILSMQLETMLAEVLRDFTLTKDEKASGDGAVVIDAVGDPQRKAKWLKDARLEIDAETKVLRKVVVNRWDRERRLVTVTYTLAGMETQPDGSYQLEGRLETPSVVYTRTNKPEKRVEILTKLYGPQIVRRWPGLNPQPTATSRP